MPSERFDLHTHSSASDGRLSPAALVAQARKKDLAGLALTDHDTVAGLDEALRAADREGVRVVPGIELTTDLGLYEVHILGLFVDHGHVQLQDRLRAVTAGRVARARRMVAKLNQLGYALSWEEVARQAPGGFLGRPHIMRALLAAGCIKQAETDAFFRAYLVPGMPAYEPHAEMGAMAAIALALAAGGVPVLAHPGRIGTEDFLRALIAEGLGGIEAFHPKHTPEQALAYARMADTFGLIATGGSDYHGEPGGTALGQFGTNLAAVRALAERAKSGSAKAFLRI